MFGWAALEKGAPFLLNFAITISLARLIPPEAYGLVAMVAIVSAIGTVLQNVGLSGALIQRRDPSEDDETTVFVANVALSVLLAIGVVLIAPAIAAVFGRAELTGIVYASAITLMISGFGIIQMALLQRQYRFRIGFVIELSATGAAGLVAIVMALAEHDVWALVAFTMMQVSVRTGLLWLIVRWRPRGRFRRTSFDALWGYSRHLFMASLYHHCATNLTSIIIGKYYSASALGLFTRAQSLQNMPTGLLVAPFQRVAFPLYSRTQDDLPHLKVLLRAHARTLSLIGAAITAGLMACANELVLVLFGEPWREAGPMLQILSAAVFLNTLSPLHSEANKAIGQSRWFLWVEVSKKTVLVVAILVGASVGVTGLLWAIVFVSVSDYCLSTITSSRFIGYCWTEQIADLFPAFAIAIIAFFAATTLTAMEEPILALALKGATITLAFAAMLLVLGNRAFPEATTWLCTMTSRTARRVFAQ